ncbi:prophage P1 protein 52, endolysin [Companilactobacillus sp. RD055328]|uniref:GH25 family lysozyme n=1 Tax=Companilactobacillus sp. RD055328 TaxID=2916634 RepID=UPI001FC80482|nr:phage tail protein [Companilactobacillus sp. RD055328]GKQ42907.1 prophage P1 protein 52, endolysin [Companilactobacillus sp. RD055328]
MYKIIAYDSPTDRVGRVIFDLTTNKHISSGKLTLKENDIDDFTLSLAPSSPLFGGIRPFKTHVDIFQDDVLIFRGRALKPTRSMSQDGLFNQTFSFESISAYLLDSTQRFLEINNTTPTDFFKKLIDVHNSQVEDYQKFTIGNVDVTNSTDNVYRYVDYSNSYQTIIDKLVSRLGGYLRVRFENGTNYIDYLKDPGKIHDNDTPIKIGKNLKSSTVEIDPSLVITRLVPLGATVEREGEHVSNPRLTISSVNGGKDYIDIPDLQNEFGIINGTNVWEDVKEAKNLKTKAEQWVKDQKTSSEHWSISALEIGANFESFKVSDSYMFINPNVSETQALRITQKEIDFLNPNISTLTFGDKKKSLSQYQNEYKKYKDSVDSLKNIVQGQNKSIDGLSNREKAQDDEIQKLKDELDKLNNGNSNGAILDVSEFQGNISFKTLKDMGVQLVIIRVQYGQSREDLTFKENLRKAKESGINYAVYAYGLYSTITEAQQEASAFFNRVKAENANPKFYMIDIEEQTATDMRGTTEAWNAEMVKLGVPADKQVAYIANHLYDSFNINVSKFGSIILPSYGANDGTIENSTRPTHPYDLWQYTSTGRISGIVGNVDMNTEPSSRFKENYLRKE